VARLTRWLMLNPRLRCRQGRPKTLTRLQPVIHIKRAYDAAAPDDGKRILVDRVWPRGLSKERLHVDAWMRDIAPSTGLRQWFAHDPARWVEFERRYRDELAQPGRQALLEELQLRARDGALTLVYSARDSEHNQAVVLRDVLEERGRVAAPPVPSAPADTEPRDSHGHG
jgi:uncharacterized protein YeaO (DUF488 family)